MSAHAAVFNERLALFSRAGEDADEVHRLYLDLLFAVWTGESLRPDAAEAARMLAEQVHTVSAGRRGHLVVLLGLLAELDDGGARDLRRHIRAGLQHYLELLIGPGTDEPLGVALVYLLAHFPEDAARILGVARRAGLADDDLARLQRCLAAFDPEAPAIGRAWPSPIRWTLADAEREQERRWLASLGPEAKLAFWDKDTRTLLAYLGAKASAAITTGRVAPDPVPNFAPEPAPELSPVRRGERPGRMLSLFDRYSDIIRCPGCGGRLTRDGARVACRDCAVDRATGHGYLDLSGEAAGAGDQIAGNSPLYLSRYEPLLRPAFLRVHGTNWDGGLSIADEDRYLAEHVRPADGPLLDLGAGTGRWTRLLAEQLGGERVIALDLASAMAGRLGELVPDSLVMRGSAVGLPFADGSLGAVNCWNTMQSIDRPEATMREIGRCLRPGGTFTMLTYRPSPDPLYRYFQRRHEACLGVTSFEREEVHAVLASAGMTVTDERVPGSFLVLTAVRH